MKKKILVTDTLFVLEEHVSRLEQAGFEVERLEKFNASEDELKLALTGKAGYILGGIERVTAEVIESAATLEAIAFTGSGYSEFIPGYETATKRGIAISAAKGANAPDVAEYTIALILEMLRNLPLMQTREELGGGSFYTARRARNMVLGVVGFGRIGREVTRLALALGFKVLVATRTKPARLPQGAELLELNDLAERVDVITVHVDKLHGHHALSADFLEKLKNGAIVINAAFPEAVDNEVLLSRLKRGELRAAFDARPKDPGYSTLGVGQFVASNGQTAFNTKEAIQDTSDRVVSSIINLLTTGIDPDLVNPLYRENRAV